jgi:hypothetical protein
MHAIVTYKLKKILFVAASAALLAVAFTMTVAQPASAATASPAVFAAAADSDPNAVCNRNQCDLIKKYVNPTINLLAVVFGLVAVISLIMGAINYMTSEGDPQKVSRAKQRIVNTVMAMLAFFFMYAFLQFLIPGGIF